MGRGRGARIAIGLVALAVGAARAEEPKPVASDVALSQEDRIQELERTVQGLTEELARTRVELAVPESSASLTSQWGYGPAASKVYERDRGLSIGGYAEGHYTAFVNNKGDESNTADLERAVLYTGYKFNDHLVFNSEIEFEHASTEETVTTSRGGQEGGSVSVEFAALDFMWKPELNARAGLLLFPVGFLNLTHEPPFYYGVHRPEVEEVLIPSTWRENGAGIFGRLGENVEYAAYAVNGMNAQGFSDEGIREGRQNGSDAFAEDLAFVGRLDWTPLDGLLVGASVYAGDSGQDQRVDLAGGGTTRIPATPTILWDVHTQYEMSGLHLRGLFTMTHIGDAGSLTRDLQAEDPVENTFAVAQGLLGGYGEAAYDVLPLIFPGTDRFLAPFYRFEWYDTQWNMPSGFGANRGQRIMVNTVGLQYEPIPNVVLKADYRNRRAAEGSLPDEFNLGFGLTF